MLVTTYQNIRAFHNEMTKAVAKRTVTDVEYRRMLTRLDKSMEGAGELKIQKMIYVRVVVGNDLSIEWINYCLPGSQKHFTRFQKDGYKLTDKTQVPQVIKDIAACAKILSLPVAEEAVCSNLKPGINTELAVRGHNMYSCELNEIGNVQVWGMDATTPRRMHLQTGGFTMGIIAHY
jgi:hypothetical protein